MPQRDWGRPKIRLVSIHFLESCGDMPVKIVCFNERKVLQVFLFRALLRKGN